MQALDRLISYLEENKADYSDYVADTISRFCFIRNATDFQDIGMVNIDYSILSYRIMFPTIRQLQEHNVREMISDKVYEAMKEAFSKSKETPKQKILIEYIIRYLANKTAELYTSQKTTEQRISGRKIEYSPTIRPIYQDPSANGNFFADQATYYAGKIRSYLTENGTELGIETISQANELQFQRQKAIYLNIIISCIQYKSMTIFTRYRETGTTNPQAASLSSSTYPIKCTGRAKLKST